MNELTPREKCWLHLIAIKYAMAGDIDSTEAIETLLARWHVIQWDDPAFLRFSREMRAGLSHVPPKFAEALALTYPAVVHGLLEELASGKERLTDSNQELKKAAKAITCYGEYILKLLGLVTRMGDRLKMLGADTSEFQIPTPPQF